MDKSKVLETTANLKIFFQKKQLKISEAKEIMFRLLDYIDEFYDEDSREVPFRDNHSLDGIKVV